MKKVKSILKNIIFALLVLNCFAACTASTIGSEPVRIVSLSAYEITGGIQLTVESSDGKSKEYVINDGESSITGSDDDSMQSITLIDVNRNLDSYVLLMKDGTTYTFTVNNNSTCAHTFADTVVAPDCETSGKETHTCTKCGLTYEDHQSAAFGHSYVAETVNADGVAKMKYTCTTCGDFYMKEITFNRSDDIAYMKDLSDFAEKTLTLSVDSGLATARSFWTAEYGEDGVTIDVMILDENVRTIHSDKGMNDNVEFHIQATQNTSFHVDYTYNFLCTPNGNYWIRRWNGSAFTYIDIAGINSPNGKLWFDVDRIEGGWRAKVFFGYSFLGVSPSQAKGNLRILPMLRNCDDTIAGKYDNNRYKFYDLMGASYDWPNTWFVLNEENIFVRKDLSVLSLAETQYENTPKIGAIIENMAKITPTVGELRHTAYSAPCFTNSNYSLDYYGFASELVDTTDFVFAYKGANSNCAKATVEQAGYVIVMFGISSNTTAMINAFAQNGWTALTGETRNPFGFMANTNYADTATYYVKWCNQGEQISILANWGVIFGARRDDTPLYSYESTPAYISMDVTQDYYLPENNVFSCGPSIAVTDTGRQFVGWHVGGTSEPTQGNCLMFAYSDDGVNWTNAFVVDTWENRIPLSSKRHVVCDYDFQAVEENGQTVIKVLYTLRLNHDGNTARNCATWTFTLKNPNAPINEWEFGKHTFAFYGVPRNGFRILENGNYISVPNSTVDERFNEVYISKDKGLTWSKVASVYAPQCTNFDETVIVEKKDGTLWLTFRTTRGTIYESFSYDGGINWTIARDSGIRNPSSRFQITRLPSGNLLLLHNDQTGARIGMTVAISTDDGATWKNKLCLYPGVCSYPAVAIGADDRIYITFDDGRYEAQQVRRSKDGNYKYWGYIYSVTLTEEQIMSGGIKKNSTPLLLIGDTYADASNWQAFEQAFATYGAKTLGVFDNTVEAAQAQLPQIVSLAPESVFLNAGITELNGGMDGATAAKKVIAFATQIKDALPNADIYLNAAIVNTKHADKAAQYQEFNKALKAFAEATKGVELIDVNELLTLPDGSVDAHKFENGFKLNVHGYAILTNEIYKAVGMGIPYETLGVVTHLSKYIGAQASLKGTILDEDGMPVKDAEVSLSIADHTFTYTTGSDGAYTFENVPQATYKIIVSATNFKERTIIGKESLPSGLSEQTIYLIANATRLGSIGADNRYDVYVNRTPDGLRFLALSDNAISSADKITFYFNIYSFVRSRSAFTMAFAVTPSRVALMHYSNSSNDLSSSNLSSTGVLCESTAHSLVGFVPYGVLNEWLAYNGVDFYSVTNDTPIQLSMLLESASETSRWNISSIPDAALQSKITALGSLYRNNAPTGTVEIASVRAMATLLADGTLGTWADVTNDGLGANVLDKLAKEKLNVTDNLTERMATVTAGSGATIESVTDGASIFTGTSSVADADATLSVFSEYTPGWYTGMNYVKKSNTASVTVTAETSGYVLVHCLASVNVNGFTEVVSVIGSDGATVKSSWFRTYRVLAKYVEAGETITIPTAAVLYVG